jgi:hypothetical protein
VLHLVAVQEVTWVEAGSQPADDYAFLCVNVNHHFFVHRGVLSACRRVEYSSERMSYIITPRGRWCDSVVRNVHK